MAEIPVFIIDPQDERHPFKLADDKEVRALIRIITGRLDLPDPEQVNYQLIPVATDEALAEDITLAEAGVAEDDELRLEPVEDDLLAQLLQELYDEAVHNLREELFEKALDKMSEIRRIKPDHPDPQSVETRAKAVQVEVTLEAPIPAEVKAEAEAPQMEVKAEPPAPPEAVEVKTPQVEAKPAKKGPSGCLIVTLVGGGVALVGALFLIFVVGVILFVALTVRTSGNSIEEPEPFFEEEPFLEEEPFEEGPMREPPAELGTGDVQVTLRWDTNADLDLHVIDPDGQEIYYYSPYSASGGELDVDANAGCAPDQMMRGPVENIFWPEGEAATGYYEILVYYYADCGDGPTDWNVRVLVDGEVSEYSGTIYPEDGFVEVTSFSR